MAYITVILRKLRACLRLILLKHEFNLTQHEALSKQGNHINHFNHNLSRLSSKTLGTSHVLKEFYNYTDFDVLNCLLMASVIDKTNINCTRLKKPVVKAWVGDRNCNIFCKISIIASNPLLLLSTTKAPSYTCARPIN